MLSSTDRSRIEERLLQERLRAVHSLQEFELTRASSLQDDTGDLSVYRLHPADIGTEAMEQEKQFLLASVEGRRLYELDEALRRLYSDPEGFGVCMECGNDIERERLEVIPEATRCAGCQRLSEA